MSTRRRRLHQAKVAWERAQTRLQRKLQAGKVDLPSIPPGPYCYQILSFEQPPDGPPVVKQHTCPYWEARPGKPEQAYGYCKLLEVGDWQIGFGLLWDQVKECGLNDPDEMYEEENDST